MQERANLSYLTLILLISFASVNAVLFTPALPDIAAFFAVSNEIAQYTISWFLIGYALGQLLYGPLTDRYGRKTALYIGIFMQILGSIACVVSGLVDCYPLLVISRFVVALGSGAGLKMTFTLVNEYYDPKTASQKIAYLMLAFAITPGLAVAIGGQLNAHFGWMSCFMGGVIYGVMLLLLVAKLPDSEKLNLQALNCRHLIKVYRAQFSNTRLITGGLLMGGASCFVYVFAAIAPFIAISIMKLSPEQYGVANIIPSLGLLMGSFCCAQLVKIFTLRWLIKVGLSCCILGSLLMMIAINLAFSPLISLFLPMMLIYFGISFIFANASTLAMSETTDKAHGSAVMNFINMGLATVIVLSAEWFVASAMLLPIIYLMLCIGMMAIYFIFSQARTKPY